MSIDEIDWVAEECLSRDGKYRVTLPEDYICGCQPKKCPYLDKTREFAAQFGDVFNYCNYVKPDG